MVHFLREGRRKDIQCAPIFPKKGHLITLKGWKLFKKRKNEEGKIMIKRYSLQKLTE